jgi:hypothetical protein
MADAKKVILLNTKLNPGDKLVDLRKRINVTATDKHPFAKKGTVTQVSEVVATKGIKLGHYESKK